MIHLKLQERLRVAFERALPEAKADVSVRPCADPKFGDFQCMSIMPLAKSLKANPRQLATAVVAVLEVDDLCDGVDIAGPGFLNFRVKRTLFVEVCQAAARGEHLFFEPTAEPRTIVVDFSSPNVAKPMHVGHIRSTILGDCLARLFRLQGHRVVTDNHIGDWGTQFGMLLIGWKQHLNEGALEADPIAELERIYKHVNAACKEDPGVLESARAELVKLQAADAENLGIWRRMIALSKVQFETIYRRLGVSFDETLGESFYNDRLGAVVADLTAAGIARSSEGAVGVFSDQQLPEKEDPFRIFRDGEWHDSPVLVQKNDGGFNYATTDLATLAYRMTTWAPAEVVYVTDGRQQLHFRQIFNAFGRWQPEAAVKLAHVWFGSILGDDGKPFKTRSGETVKLADLLDEAEERARRIVDEKNPDLDEATKAEIARVVGIGAVKYADLLPNRQSDYVFSWDKMLSLQGNTAVYLQYACTRIRSIFRKATEDGGVTGLDPAALCLAHDDEMALARKLMEFGIVLNQAGEDYRPNLLCNYLFELAGCFSRFFEHCPVLKATAGERASRLVLCDLTGRVLRQGLDVLGIGVTEVM